MSTSRLVNTRVSLFDLLNPQGDTDSSSIYPNKRPRWSSPLTPISGSPSSSAYSPLRQISPPIDKPAYPLTPSPTPPKVEPSLREYADIRRQALERANLFEAGRKWVENWICNEEAWDEAVTRPSWSSPIPPEIVTSELILSKLHGVDSSPFLVDSPFIDIMGCTPGLPLDKIAAEFGEDMSCIVYDATSSLHLNLTLSDLCEKIGKKDIFERPLNAHTITLDGTSWERAGNCRLSEIVDRASASHVVKRKDQRLVDALQQQVLAIASSGSYTVSTADNINVWKANANFTLFHYSPFLSPKYVPGLLRLHSLLTTVYLPPHTTLLLYPIDAYNSLILLPSFQPPHIDPGGMANLSTLDQGQKIWFLSPPSPKVIQKYYECLMKEEPGLSPWFYDVDCVYVVQQKAGQTIFIPPGWLHAVYTLETAIMYMHTFVTVPSISINLDVWSLERKHKIHQGDRIPGFLNYILALCYAITEKLEVKVDIPGDKAMWRRVAEFLVQAGGRNDSVAFGWRSGDQPHPAQGTEAVRKSLKKAGKKLVGLLI